MVAGFLETFYFKMEKMHTYNIILNCRILNFCMLAKVFLGKYISNRSSTNLPKSSGTVGYILFRSEQTIINLKAYVRDSHKVAPQECILFFLSHKIRRCRSP